MNTHVQEAKRVLFEDIDGLQLSNFKLYPGTNRETTADEIAAELMKSVREIQSGVFEDITVE